MSYRYINWNSAPEGTTAVTYVRSNGEPLIGQYGSPVNGGYSAREAPEGMYYWNCGWYLAHTRKQMNGGFFVYSTYPLITHVTRQDYFNFINDRNMRRGRRCNYR